MKDFLGILAIVVAGTALIMGVFTLFGRDRRPWAISGAPSYARCGYPDRGIRTCVADGIAYTCVESWTDSTITCGVRPR